jgi:RNA polymerase sigma factor (sigma-70 family)
VQPPTSAPARAVSSSPAPNDGEVARLVRGASQGDQRAWGELIPHYPGLLWGVARAHRLSAADAADVIQTSWLRLVEHLPKIKNPDGVGAWLATTARRESLRTCRQATRCQPSDEIEVFAGTVSGEHDARLLTAERDDALRCAFARLPERDQALLRLLTSDPALSYEEIAAGLGVPIGSIGPTRARSLQRLRRELRRTKLFGDAPWEWTL